MRMWLAWLKATPLIAFFIGVEAVIAVVVIIYVMRGGS